MYINEENQRKSFEIQARIWNDNRVANTPDEVITYEAKHEVRNALNLIEAFEDALDEWRKSPGCPTCRDRCRAMASILRTIFLIGATRG